MKRQTLLGVGVLLILIVLTHGLIGHLTGEESSKNRSVPFQSDSQSPQIARLEILESYRASRTVWLVKENSSEEVNTTTAKCVRKPLAIHVAYHDPETGFEEQVAIGNTVWNKKMSEVWKPTESEGRMNDIVAAAESFWGFTVAEIEALLCSDCTTLVDTETINGVRCKHYVVDKGMPALHVEAWVADQPDLPPVLIRGLRREIEKNVAIHTEVNLTDINKSLTIEPPE